jgi:signal peptidase I
MAATPGTGTTAGDTPRWGQVLRVAAARGLLAAVASLLLWALVPVVLGWQPQLILTGSMEPRIMPGDLVVTRPVDPTTLHLGQVVTVTDPDHSDGRTRTHRIVRIDDHGDLVLRGDNNPMDDSSPVPLDTVHGVGVLRVPYVGRPLLWMGQHQYLPLGLTLLVLAWAVSTVLGGLGSRRDESDDEGEDDAGSDGSGLPEQRTPRRVGPTLAGQRRRRLGAGILGLVATSWVLGSAPADAAFRQAIGNPTSSFTAAAVFSGYADTVLDDNPMLFWRLNEASGGTAADASGNGRTGSYANVGSYGVTGALLSDSSNKAVRLSMAAITANASTVGPSNFTLEAWIKTSTTTGGRILGFGNGGGINGSTTVDRQLYVGNNGRVYFGVGANKKVVASPSRVNDGAWHQVVAIYTSSGQGMKLFVDGDQVATGTGQVISMSGYWRAGAEQMSGWTANPSDEFFDGDLDEVSVYTTALSATQVAAHYTASGR